MWMRHERYHGGRMSHIRGEEAGSFHAPAAFQERLLYSKSRGSRPLPNLSSSTSLNQER